MLPGETPRDGTTRAQFPPTPESLLWQRFVGGRHILQRADERASTWRDGYVSLKQDEMPS